MNSLRLRSMWWLKSKVLKTKNKPMKIKFQKINFGADPEFFFTKNGQVVGAEKVLPEKGLTKKYVEQNWGDDGKIVEKEVDTGEKMVIIDGVQAEFNVEPSTCRQSFSGNLHRCFLELEKQTKNKKVDISIAQTVEVSEKEMKSLAPASQQFGCEPSKNAYADVGISIKDASKYRYRSAGGHLHLGHMEIPSLKKALTNHKDMARLLDIIVGNTCVLLDRDPGNVERRKVYGRAGEYRTPKHGLEYRTLSNFWLRCYPLASLVLALARFAVNVATSPEAEKLILDCVDMKDIERAINTNDYKLALENFNKVKGAIASIGAEGYTDAQLIYPLQGERLTRFEYFVEKGVDHFFKEDPMKHWLNPNLINKGGWEKFIDQDIAVIAPDAVKPLAVASMN